MNNEEDTLRAEYPSTLITSGERGKYTNRYKKETHTMPNTVAIEPDLHKLFPDTESVNIALRKYAKEHHLLLS